jgi:hypothetical protein
MIGGTPQSLWISRRLLYLSASLVMATGCRSTNSFSSGGQRPGVTQTSTPVVQSPPVSNNPQIQPPVPQGAIVQGSFTVWADPPNPSQGQRYNIHMRVKLPSNVGQYSRADLSGTLFGTDGYFQTINGMFGFIQPFYFDPSAGFAELVMPIPGAKQGVHDSLKVSSAVLQESQTINIIFGQPNSMTWPMPSN